ncbi:MAG: choice-of-anchor D domain-containing protein [Candidatus Acidiferrales bacterium]
MNGTFVLLLRLIRLARRGERRGPLVCGAVVLSAAAALFLLQQVPKQRHNPAVSSKTAPIALSTLAARNATQRLANLGWAFEPNVGQSASEVKFLARARGATVFLTDDSVYVSWARAAHDSSRRAATKGNFLRFEFAGAGRAGTRRTGDTLLPGKTNYLLGRNARQWHTDVPHYAAVQYAGLYPGVDARFYGGAQGLEYDLTAARGSDLRQILLRVRGTDALYLDPQGDLVIRNGARQIIMKRPYMYQLDGGVRKSVTGGYRLLSGNEVGFEIGKYRADLPLVIDPSISIAYTTFLGGAGAEKGNSVAVDSSGDIYVGGTTTLPTFPETATFTDGSASGSSTLFVAKVDPTQTGAASLIYLTFIGGSGSDQGGMVALDHSATPPNLAILGWTTSTNFPVTNPASVFSGTSDLTITDLNGVGSAPIYSKYFGGSSAAATQNVAGIATDAIGDVFVTSDTTSSNLPVTATAVQSTFVGPDDGLLAEFASGTGALVYCTYLGINSQTVGSTGVAVDASGNAYVAGFTSTTTTSFANGFQDSYPGGSLDGFVMEINPATSGTAGLVYGSFIGGTGSDQAFAIAVDTASPANAYVTGTTSSTDFVSQTGLTNAFQSSLGSGATNNAFLAVINQAPVTFVPSLTYVSYLGGTASDSGQGIAVNSSVTPPEVLVAGRTTSNSFPVLCTAQNFTGSEDAFIAEFNPTASGSASLTVSTLLGGSVTTEASAVATDSSGDAIIFGDTLSPDYPLAGNPQTGFQLTCTSCTLGTPLSDAFLTKSPVSTTPSGCLAFSPASATFGPSFPVGSTNVPPISVLVTNDGNATLTFSGISIIGNNAADFQLLSGTTCTASTVLTTSGAGSTCDLAIGFTPNVAGSETATVQFTDDGAGSPQGLDLTGTGTAPEVTLTTSPPTSPPALTFGSVTVNTTSGAQDVTLTNSGNVALTISSVVIDSSVGNPSDFIVNPAGTANECGSSGANPVPPNGSCTIAVEFTPNATGPLTGQVDVNDNAGNSSAAQQTIAVSGTGVAQTFIVGVSPTSLTFLPQNVGATSSPQSVTLTNTGTGTLNITGITLTGANANQFQIYSPGTTCSGAGVSPNGGTCTIAVELAPKVVGPASASVSITDNAPTSPQSVLLMGAGAGAVASLSASTLTFGSVSVGNTSTAQTVTLTNNGNANLILSDLGISGANPGDFQITPQTTCAIGGTGIAQSGSCNIVVDFVPLASGSRFATVNIADNAAGSPQIVSLSGTGTAPAVTLSPTSLSFGNVNVGTTSTLPSITLTNTGNQTLTISSVNIDPTVGTPGDFALSGSNTCKAVGALQPNANCTITVSFTPALKGGAIGQVDIADNASGSPQTVPLSGTGTAAGIVLTPSILTFAGQNPGTPASPPQTVTLQNTGSGPLTISSIAITGTNSGDFAQTNNCPIGPSATLGSGNACSIAVTFAPTGTGPRSASLSVSDNSLPSPQVVALSGIGTVPGAQFNLPTIQFGTVIVGAHSGNQAVQLNNTGNGVLVISKVGFVGANPGDFQASGSCVGANGASVSVAAGSNCAVIVAFAPMAAGSRGATLSVTDNASTSPQQLPVTGTATNFQLSTVSGGSTSATVAAGETATFSLQVTPANGFTGKLTMSSADPIPASMSTISPTQVVVSGSQPAGFTVTVTTTAPNATASHGPFFPRPMSGNLRIVMGFWLLAVALLTLWKWKSHSQRPFRPALLLVGVLLLASCGGGGGNPSPTGTPAGTYTVTITGAISGVMRTVNLSITVQ